jgi:lysyl-tRNA synthetase class 2
MLNKKTRWPARTRRNAFIAEVIKGFEHGVSFEQNGGRTLNFRRQVKASLGACGERGAVGAKNLSGKSVVGAQDLSGNGLNLEEVNGVFVAGRVIGILDGGFVLQDESGRMNISRNDAVNVGDIVEVQIGVEEKVGEDGRAFKIFAALQVKVLAECAEEYFIRSGDPNWKRAVVDLSVKEKLKTRSLIVAATRDFFIAKGFTEVDTPEMVLLPGMEPNLDPFKTRLMTRDFDGCATRETDAYLITSPEYAMKKLLAGGWEKIFQITKSFRNGETGGRLHNPEFTMLEWYRAFSDYRAIMEDTEQLVNSLARQFCGSEKIIFGNFRIDTSLPFERKRVSDLFEEYVGISAEVLTDKDALGKAAAAKGYKISDNASYEDIFYAIFLNEIEFHLGAIKPVIVFDYPAQMGALAKKSEEDPRFVERFELYVGGMELCNAFTELNDPVEQMRRLEEERRTRQKIGKDVYPVDQSFIGALRFGMPPAGGNALGIDRLVMALTNTADISNIMYFPLRDLK